MHILIAVERRVTPVDVGAKLITVYYLILEEFYLWSSLRYVLLPCPLACAGGYDDILYGSCGWPPN